MYDLVKTVGFDIKEDPMRWKRIMLLALLLSLVGCERKPRNSPTAFVEAEITKVDRGKKMVWCAAVSGKEYVINIGRRRRFGSNGTKTIDNMVVLLEVGQSIKFPVGWYGRRGHINWLFSSDGIGCIGPNDIIILDKLFNKSTVIQEKQKEKFLVEYDEGEPTQ